MNDLEIGQVLRYMLDVAAEDLGLDHRNVDGELVIIDPIHSWIKVTYRRGRRIQPVKLDVSMEEYRSLSVDGVHERLMDDLRYLMRRFVDKPHAKDCGIKRRERTYGTVGKATARYNAYQATTVHGST